MKYIINKKTFKEINNTIESQTKFSVVEKKQYDFTRFRKEQEFSDVGLLEELNLSDDNYRVFHHKKFLITGGSIDNKLEDNIGLEANTENSLILIRRKKYLDAFLVKEILLQLGFYFKLASYFRVLNFDIKISDSQQFLRNLLDDEKEFKKNLYFLEKRNNLVRNLVKLMKRNKSDNVWLLTKNALKKRLPILNKIIYRNTLKSIVNQIINNEKRLSNISLKIINFYKKYDPERNLQLDVIHETKPESRIVNYNVWLAKNNNKYSASTLLFDKLFIQKPLSILTLSGYFNKKRFYNFGYLNVLNGKNLEKNLFFYRNLLIKTNSNKVIEKDNIFEEKNSNIIPIKVGTLIYSIKSRIKFNRKKKIKKNEKKSTTSLKNNFDSIPSFDTIRYFFYKNYSFSSQNLKSIKSNVFHNKNKLAFSSFLSVSENMLQNFDLDLLEYLKDKNQ